MVKFKRTTDTAWTTVPMAFATAIDNNKYYSAAIPAGAFPTGTVVQYYLVIAYDDHDTTFLQAAPPTSLRDHGRRNRGAVRRRSPSPSRHRPCGASGGLPSRC